MPRLPVKVLAVVLLAAAGACSKAAPAGAPLVADFRQFCVDTALVPDAVKAAAERAGARPVAAAVRGPPSWNWDHAIDGRTIRLKLAVAPAPAAGPGQPAVCTISDDADAGASLKAVRSWVGAPAGDGDFEQYYFTLADGRPHLVPRDSLPPARARSLSGGLYRLTLASFGGSTALTLQN
jgi:hypothetical protein